jgi:DNA-binding NarL/FixJ family response regulator
MDVRLTGATPHRLMIQVLIADDNEVALGIISEMLQTHDGWNVCARASNGREAISKAIELKPDVVILDLAMPDTDGLTAARAITKGLPSAAILIYTLHEGALIELEAKKAGVRRVVSKMSSPESLVSAVEEVLKLQEKETKPAARIPIISTGPLADVQSDSVQALPSETPQVPPAEPEPSGSAN